MLYFAFGSNLLPSRLQRRCPTARVLTPAIASSYRVTFDKLSEDSSGKANLIACDAPDAAPGVVYELSADDLGALDAVEGPGYRRQEDFSVTGVATGEALVTCTYVARKRVPGLKPYDWYLALVLAGLACHDIDPSYSEKLRMTRFDTDAQQSRKSRRNALQDLRVAGYANYLDLLRQPS
jgi:hypothetical protein